MATAAWLTLPAADWFVDALTVLCSSLPYLNYGSEYDLEKQFEGQHTSAFDSSVSSIAFSRDIEIEKVSFHCPGAAAAALQDVNFCIQAGEMVGLMGFSGAGKSMLVNIIAGLIPPESGHIKVDGAPITKDN